MHACIATALSRAHILTHIHAHAHARTHAHTHTHTNIHTHTPPRTGVCADGAKALSGALLENHWLETMELGYNAIADLGARQLATAVQRNTV